MSSSPAISSHQFPMDRVLYNLHHKCCSFALQKTSHRSRRLAEHGILVFAVCCFGALLLAHLTFVQKGTRSTNIPSTCLKSIPGFDKDAAVTHLALIEDGISSVILTNERQQEQEGEEDEFCALIDPSEILFSYSREKGYLFLSPEISKRHHVAVQYVKISKTDAKCFGEPFLQTLIGLTGPDTVMINWLLGVYDNGFIYNQRTNAMFDLNVKTNSSYANYFSEETKQRTLFRNIQQLISKGAVVMKTCFLFFITTTLVSFTLRETQGRMLDFTHHLQQYVRANRPVVNLVTTHVVENLVFVPIMVGMIFFLIEFYRGDKFLAFMVLSLVWVCESFSVVSLRTKQGIHFFPRMFFFLFSLFHFYNFSFPYGFSYAALATSMCFMMHSMLFFWHRYELPAVALGRVTPERPRQGISSSASSTPSVESDNGQTTPDVTVPVPLRRRGNLGSTQSFTTVTSQVSRQSSTTAMFQGGDDDDESYMYYLGGEVVMHRRGLRTPSPFTPVTDQATPQDPAAVTTEPRRNRTTRFVGNQRFVNELGTVVASAISTEEDNSRSSPQLRIIESQDNADRLPLQDDAEISALQVILSATGGSPPEHHSAHNSSSSGASDSNPTLTMPGVRSGE